MTASASTLRTKIDDYFWKFGSNIAVTRTGYDDQDLETSDSSLVVKYVFRIKLKRRINSQTFNMAFATLSDSQGSVDISPPEILSSAPLRGSFRMQCTDWSGNTFTTNDIRHSTWTEGIDTAI